MQISPAEHEVLRVLWQISPLGAAEIATALSAARRRSDRTVKTLLARLVDKGAVTTTVDGRRYLYAPAIAEQDFQRRAATQFVDRLFGGRAAPLVAQLADANGLSADDIAELEALIRELKK